MKIAILPKIGPQPSSQALIGYLPVISITRMKLLIQAQPDEDIEGKIYPDARFNPELRAILQAIYDHKKKLHRDDNLYPPFYENFRIHIRDNFKIDLTP